MNILVFDSTNIPTIDLASKRNLDVAGHFFDDLNKLDDLTNLVILTNWMTCLMLTLINFENGSVTMETEKLITMAELKSCLRVSQSTLSRLIKAQTPPCDRILRIGRRLYLAQSVFNNWVLSDKSLSNGRTE
jgi:hypothetical protein